MVLGVVVLGVVLGVGVTVLGVVLGVVEGVEAAGVTVTTRAVARDAAYEVVGPIHLECDGFRTVAVGA